jgi:protein-tyrosine phosphatase
MLAPGAVNAGVSRGVISFYFEPRQVPYRPEPAIEYGLEYASPNQKGANDMTKVLFVCMGNICRSPTAEGVFRKLVREAGLEDSVQIASSGTHAYHVGEAPDLRAQQAALKRGYDLGDLKARQITQDDFRDFDLILAMDWENLALLQQQCPRSYKHKLHLLMRFAGEHDAATVPDPYYGGPEGFNTVLDYVEDACQGLIEVVRRRATMYAAA